MVLPGYGNSAELTQILYNSEALLSKAYRDDKTKELIADNDLEMTNISLEINSFSNTEDDIAELVEFGFSSLQHIGTIWQGELDDVEIKQRFQKWLFSAGIPFDGEIFGTTALPLCLSIKRDFSREKSLLVIPAGIEPALPD